MIKTIYVIVVLAQQWSGNYTGREISGPTFADFPACQQYVNTLNPQSQPAPQLETINPVTRQVIKYECRAKNIWVPLGRLG